jgi:hypothetical protein
MHSVWFDFGLIAFGALFGGMTVLLFSASAEQWHGSDGRAKDDPR